ncbi:hypothetical protein sscle_03g030020 [Sclerotinia sclerotiorum 1980 UF-70]|uniref:Peptidase S33 tripeptidyl aminopeptidase-like C-terminal domain-containing protein n=1 Tax=Sclerotinia sclerotiorum (strain ATCC 18683 / 1980 / Ss-1) TaxID=665079 RepID=A0A1D9Q095_SCLS1|nr:hypothetical protein sscle_03g030020 [Sclerotinia sclerotiorum 1980 UF-70]
MQEFDMNETKGEENRSLLPKSLRRVRNVRVARSYSTWPGLTVATLFFVWWTCSVISGLVGSRGPTLDMNGDKYYDFDEILPSEKLNWHPCFDFPGSSFKCARLTVPMDYHRPLNESDDNPKVHIALILIPGNHTGPRQFSKSPLLLNPGGPGGSGTLFGLTAGRSIQSIVGEDQDVIGFDPRGVGATTPRADCFSYGGTYNGVGDDQARGDYHRTLFAATGQGIGLANSSSTALRYLDARAKTIAKLCAEKDSLSGDNSIFRHAGTPSVARDMISIIDAWDEWTSNIEESLDFDSADLDPSDEKESYDNSQEAGLETKSKLLYWGFSYGTLLGSTFAAMFPDRVGRLVLDGVVDADHYVAPIWRESQRDADKVWSSFFKYCQEVKSACQFYRVNDQIVDIEERFKSVIENLKENPISLVLKDTQTPFLMTYSDVKLLIFGALYAPIQGFASVAQLLDNLERSLGDWFEFTPTPLSYDLKPVCEHAQPRWSYPNDAQRAILCSDKKYPLNHTFPEIESMFKDLEAQSTFADAWMSLMIQCSGYNIESIDPPMQWDNHPSHRQKPIKTAFPLLYISNSADPVTPLIAGVKMATKFVDAGFFEQQSEGHCTIAAKSRCTIEKIRAYFREGKVPDPPKLKGKGTDFLDGDWEICPTNEWPWHEYQPSAQISNEIDAAEIGRIDAWGSIRDAFAQIDIWGARGSKKFEIVL